MQSVRSRTQRFVTTALVAAGLAGLLTGCGGARPTTAQAEAAPAGQNRTAPLGQPNASAAPQDARTPHPVRTLPVTQAPRASRPAPSSETVRPRNDGPASTAPRDAPAATSTPPTPTPTPTAQRLPEGRLTVSDAARLTAEINGLPASPRLVPGGAPVEFTVTLRNTGNTDFPLIAPVVRFDQYEGGLAPLGSVAGRLERFDPATGTWKTAPLPQAAGMDFLLVATDGAPLPRNAVMTIRYRVAIDDGPRAGVTELQVYAVSQPSNQQAGMAAAKVTIAP